MWLMSHHKRGTVINGPNAPKCVQSAKCKCECECGKYHAPEDAGCTMHHGGCIRHHTGEKKVKKVEKPQKTQKNIYLFLLFWTKYVTRGADLSVLSAAPQPSQGALILGDYGGWSCDGGAARLVARGAAQPSSLAWQAWERSPES